ncbi:hypothetical protein RhiirC2_799348 [Rhizophagus irregularis]|uniref:Uncharacterized protein n=1 Tax=Rhizophagus irregularis TaxID=588596 RepID=A0A2N1M597_9GLOM|nr:hypothetical protein RhiirC2_799348 [Rhizophagus irregularis]
MKSYPNLEYLNISVLHGRFKSENDIGFICYSILTLAFIKLSNKYLVYEVEWNYVKMNRDGEINKNSVNIGGII